MRIPLRWLRQYVEFDADAAALAHALTMSGTKIEAVHGGAAGFEGVRVGRVLECGPHPDADRLRVCQVQVGAERLHIVCGASNVRAGLTVAVACVGARLPGDLRIRKSKIRGQVSEGMICSGRELGIAADGEGILELDPQLECGADYASLVAGEPVLEAEITPNRPDCLAMLGIAREVAALYGKRVQRPAAWVEPEGLPACPVPIAIENPADCSRYLGRVLEDVRVEPSPEWLQSALRALGAAPINNVVDITNYVLFETGQPLHAFDLDRLRGPRLDVRRARAGETLRTLDGVERRLDPDILVIADAAAAVAAAGVMGGLDSAVRDSTRRLLLESACFDPGRVRIGRRKLGLSTDASYRFERGADPEGVRWAADRATQLLCDLAGARIATAAAAPGDRAPARPAVRLRVERANRLIGTELEPSAMAALLARIELPASETNAGELHVTVPSFRRDVSSEIDLIEEVARLHGYERIPAERMPPAPAVAVEAALRALARRIRDRAVDLGYYEVRTSAFMERDDPDRLGLPPEDPRRQAVRLRNPLVPTLDTMRTTLLPGMLRLLGRNARHEQEPLRFVQVDRVFLNRPGTLPGLPTESERLFLLSGGHARPLGWAEPAREVDLYDLKGDVDALAARLGLALEWFPGSSEPTLDPALSFEIAVASERVGRGGAVRGEILGAFDCPSPVFAFELELAALAGRATGARQWREPHRHPAVKRDLSLVVPAGVTYGDLELTIRATAGPLLESVQCFDVYRMGRSPAGGERSLGLRLRFRAPSRTLSEAEVTPLLDAVVDRLATAHGVSLRAV
jgi:phenylalanyl-tRNA synthetase beta chain